MVPSREFLSAKRGYVCAVIDYRKIQDDPAVRGVLSASPADLSGQAEVIRSTFAPEFPLDQVRRGIEAGFDDTVRAIEWMVESAASLGVDPARIAVGGWSAGSVNSLWAAYVEKAPVAAVWSNSGGLPVFWNTTSSRVSMETTNSCPFRNRRMASRRAYRIWYK